MSKNVNSSSESTQHLFFRNLAIGSFSGISAVGLIQPMNFTDTMTIGSYIEQLERTKQTKEEQLVYYGIVLFGRWEKVSELTKKFSLWR